MNIFKLLTVGSQFKNPATWLNVQSLTNVVASLVGGGVMVGKLCGFDLYLSDDQIVQIAGAVGTLLFVGNSIVSVASHKDAGL